MDLEHPHTAADRERVLGLSAPHPRAYLFEFRALIEFGALLPTSPWLLAQPKGDGRPIVVLPGFLADDRSTWPLRRFLRYLGYEAHGWGRGRNRGHPEQDAQLLRSRVVEIATATGQPVTLIGWSLGGVIARLLAMHESDSVREIITLGTPIEGGPKYTRAKKIYEHGRGVDLMAFAEHIHVKNQEVIDCPITVIYSHSDGIVGWRAAIDRYNSHAEHVRVRGSHLGLAFNPRVWARIAKTLVLDAQSPRPGVG